MKPASQALIDLLNSNSQFLMADLYTLTLLNGTVLRHTSADIDLQANGQTYSAGGLQFKRGKVREVAGLEVDTLDVTIFSGPTDLVGSVPFSHAAANGALDGAYFSLDRVFMPSWGDTSAGSLPRFSGRVAQVTPGRSETRLTVNSDLEILNIKMPRNLYQPPCLHSLFDAGCGLSKAAFAINGSAASGSSKTAIQCGLTQPAGYFDLGTLRFSGGQNSGVTRSVRSYSPGLITLSLPLPYGPAAGDSFTIYPGCDRSQATCRDKFGNLARFRAYPYIPAPETVV